ncbi:serine/threonine-protein kinase [Streptomyces sp. NPDC050504]|uniref:serine/threonine-protein kinase n=1 Tax=Streptomyces sp. NPDC050504 TaxID=3365618 RepID=UPI0037961012
MHVPRAYRVGAWTVGDPLGSGGFATVYEGHRTAPGEPRTAALKFLPTGTHTPRQLRHLRDLAQREVEMLRRVRAPRLIRMHEVLTVDDPDSPELDGATVIVLDLADSSLDALLHESPGPPAGPHLLAQVCEGLQQLHRAGWIHGDLKPANVLLQDGEARLADFNMAAELEGTHAYSPAFATPDYTPPELLWGQIGERGRLIRPTADVWAFGVLAHVVLTGSLPFPGGTASARRDAVLRYARGTEPLRLSGDIEPAWRDIIADCLAPDHERRAAHTAAALLHRVRAAVRAGATSPPAPPRPRGTHRGLLALACAVAVTALGFGLRGLAQDRDPGSTPSASPASPTKSRAAAANPSAGSSSPVGYDRCISGSVCFFTASNGGGRMCAWGGDENDWLTGKTRCSWAGGTRPRSAYNNGLGTSDGESLVHVRYFTEKHLQRQLGCIKLGTKVNFTAPVAPRSHVWVEEC